MLSINTDEILEPEFLQRMCKLIVEKASYIPNGSVHKCFSFVNESKILKFLEKLIIQLCVYGFADSHATSRDQTEIKLDHQLILKPCVQHETQGYKQLDFYLIRRAHLMFMTRTGHVIGLHEVRNLADIACNAMLDLGISSRNVNFLRYRMSRINIMQISGYFEVDKKKFERDGVSHLINGEFCMNLLNEMAGFRGIEQIPKAIRDLGEEEKQKKEKDDEMNENEMKRLRVYKEKANDEMAKKKEGTKKR